jgi:Ca-activated chloride channel family protein
MKMIGPKTLAAYLASVLILPALVSAAGAATPQPRLQSTGTAPVLRVADHLTISAPETVDPGATITVTISGSRPGGRIELWGPVVTRSDKGGFIDSVAEPGAFAVLTAPATPGSYELRYVSSTETVLARQALDVAAVPIMLSAPHSLGPGIGNEIEWRGPASPGDMIQVYDPTSRAVLSEVPAEGRPGAVNIAVLRGPERMGEFQIRYWSGTRQAVLRSLAVTIGEGDAWLRSPIEVFVGERFETKWIGSTETDHAYQIVDPATGTVLTSQPASGSAPAMLKAPARPGAYRVRFVNLATGFILADLPLDVDPK